MRKIIFTLIVVSLAVLLAGCAPPGTNSGGTGFFEVRGLSSNVKEVANSADIVVYKFNDGVRTCYFTETQASFQASGIWCSQ
jgi:hypothetical protein